MTQKSFIDQLPDPLEVDLFDAYDMHYRFETADKTKVLSNMNELLTWAKNKLNLAPITIELSAENNDTTDATLYFKSISEMAMFRKNPVVNIYAKRKTQQRFSPVIGQDPSAPT